jgi:hypothetical protein
VTAERYAAVFTGLLSLKEPGEYTYLTMSDDPFGTGGTSTLHRRRPPYKDFGAEISFHDLPQRCRHLVLKTYLELWNLYE